LRFDADIFSSIIQRNRTIRFEISVIVIGNSSSDVLLTAAAA